MRQLLFLYVFCFEEVTTELQIPIRPIMRTCRSRYQVRGCGQHWARLVYGSQEEHQVVPTDLTMVEIFHG